MSISKEKYVQEDCFLHKIELGTESVSLKVEINFLEFTFAVKYSKGKNHKKYSHGLIPNFAANTNFLADFFTQSVY